MTAKKYTFGPKNTEEAATFAAERLIGEVQLLVHELMAEQGVSKSELANRLGVSKPRISRLLGHHAQNVTLDTAARVIYALGDELEVRRKSQMHALISDVRNKNAKRPANENWPSAVQLVSETRPAKQVSYEVTNAVRQKPFGTWNSHTTENVA